jgi:hypothetical protein
METFQQLGLNFMTLIASRVRPPPSDPGGRTLALTGRIADIYEAGSGGGVLISSFRDRSEGWGDTVFISRNVISRRA